MGKVNKILSQAMIFADKHSGAILTGLSVSTGLGAVVLAIRQTPKAMKHIEEKKMEVNASESANVAEGEEYVERDLTAKEVIQATWKDYIIVAGLEVLSAGCSIYANKENSNKLAGALVAINDMRDYIYDREQKELELTGEKKATTIHDAIVQDRVAQNPVEECTVIDTHSGNTLCYDPWSNTYFRANVDFVRKAYSELTEHVKSEDYASMNDFYDYLMLDNCKMANDIGWSSSRLCGKYGPKFRIQPKFTSIVGKDDIPILVLGFDYGMEPTYGFKWD